MIPVKNLKEKYEKDNASVSQKNQVLFAEFMFEILEQLNEIRLHLRSLRDSLKAKK